MAARWSPSASGEDCFWLLRSRGSNASLCPRLWRASDVFMSAETWDESPGAVYGELLSTNTKVGEGLQRLPLVLRDLPNGGSYFHHAATSPHWPCNGAAPRLDWLPRLKTPFSRSWRCWRSGLARHASVHRLVFAYIPLLLVGVPSRWWGSYGTGCTENLQPPDVCWCKPVRSLVEYLLYVLCLTCDWGF